METIAILEGVNGKCHNCFPFFCSFCFPEKELTSVPHFIVYPVFHVCFSALCSFNTRLFPYFAKKFSRLLKSPGSHGMHSPQQLIYKPDENGKHWSQQHLYFSLPRTLALLLLDLTIKCMKYSEKAI